MACFPLFSLPIVPNSGGDLWWFAVVWLVWGGLSSSHTERNCQSSEAKFSAVGFEPGQDRPVTSPSQRSNAGKVLITS